MRTTWCLILGFVLVAAVASEALAGPPVLAPQPKVWEGFRLWPGRAIKTLGPGSTSPALAASEQQLLLGEIFQGGVYVSELDPATAGARWTKSVAAALSGRDRTGL